MVIALMRRPTGLMQLDRLDLECQAMTASALLEAATAAFAYRARIS